MNEPQKPTEKELMERQFDIEKREKVIAQMRAGVVRNQIIRAYEILESIRFDYISDTAFRDKVVKAKRSLESAFDDFLLDSQYHKDVVKKYRDMTIEEFQDRHTDTQSLQITD